MGKRRLCEFNYNYRTGLKTCRPLPLSMRKFIILGLYPEERATRFSGLSRIVTEEPKRSHNIAVRFVPNCSMADNVRCYSHFYFCVNKKPIDLVDNGKSQKMTRRRTLQ